MELKVWVEGIPRVVCGVGEATTCQEVVVALANAIGKTGRYTFIEKWRETEHLLAPTDSPVKALSKWGEYAPDVQFLLRYSASGEAKTRPGHRSKYKNHNNNNLKGVGEDSMMRPKYANVKRNLTFNGTFAGSPLKGQGHHNKTSSHDNSSLESLEEQSSFTSSTTSTSSPYASLENRAKMDMLGRTLNGMIPENSAVTPSSPNHHRRLYNNIQYSGKSSTTTSGGSTPQDFPTPMNSLERRPQKISPLRDDSDSAERSPLPLLNSFSRPRTLNSSMDTRSSSSSSKISSDSEHYHHRPHRIVTASGINHSSSNRLQQTWTPMDTKTDSTSVSSSSQSSPSIAQSDSKEKGEDIKGEEEYTERLVEVTKEELLRLVNLQVERLRVQESEINQLETEISQCESNVPNDTNEADVDINSLAEEFKHLEVTENDLENYLEELELVSWDEKVLREKERYRKLSTELNATRAKLKACEGELKDKREALDDLSRDIGKESMDAKDEEIQLRKDVEELSKEVKEKLEEFEEQEQRLNELLEECQEIEEIMKEKEREELLLEEELREANFEEFANAPPVEIPEEEGDTSPLVKRPGSARKIYYNPTALKEAISISTNDTTCWV